MSEQVPEKCPVCGETKISSYAVSDDKRSRWLDLWCGAQWREAPDLPQPEWSGCADAMKVALELLAARTDPTPPTTPAAAARDALVAAAVAWELAGQEIDKVPAVDLHAAWSNAGELGNVLSEAVRAYLAAQEPTP